VFAKRRQVAETDDWLDELRRTEDRVDEEWAELLAQRPAPAIPGVDLSAITAVAPAFDAHAFVAIARDTFSRVRSALADGDIHTVLITAAAVCDNRIVVTVRLHVVATAHAVDEGDVLSGEDGYDCWDEDWTFAHVLGPLADDRWHVAAIEHAATPAYA
jgi:predicted lipid-binding transport protein (Tim44 family)